MVTEWCVGLSSDSGQRCVQCGELIDPVIMQNRTHKAAEHHPVSNGRVEP
jgi:hypothetical protein